MYFPVTINHSNLVQNFVNYGRKMFYRIGPRGLYYKSFYGSNCCHIVISQSVFHFLSLPPQPNICGPDQEPTISAESSMGLYSGMIEPFPQILDYGGSDRKWQTLQLILIRQQLLPQYSPQKVDLTVNFKNGPGADGWRVTVRGDAKVAAHLRSLHLVQNQNLSMNPINWKR